MCQPSVTAARRPTPARPAHPVRRPPGGRRARSTIVLAALLAAATLTVAPRPVAADTPETYAQCLALVDDYTDRCLGQANSWGESFACKWAGGVGIIACAIAEAIEQLARGVTLPPTH